MSSSCHPGLYSESQALQDYTVKSCFKKRKRKIKRKKKKKVKKEKKGRKTELNHIKIGPQKVKIRGMQFLIQSVVIQEAQDLISESVVIADTGIGGMATI